MRVVIEIMVEKFLVKEKDKFKVYKLFFKGSFKFVVEFVWVFDGIVGC